MLQSIRDAAGFAAAYGVSRETIERLQIYHAALLAWNPRINLISRKTESEIWSRHFADSAQLAVHGQPGIWADLGAGAGFPGLVIAAMQPDRSMTLVESDQRKAAFLISTAHKMGLSLRVESVRIEALDPLNAQVLSARALAPLDQLLEFAARHLAGDGICLFPKGAQAESELTLARQNWHIDAELIVSQTDPAATLLKIRKFERVADVS